MPLASAASTIAKANGAGTSSEEALAPAPLPTPAVVVVGETVTLAERIAWFDAAASAGLMG